MWLVFCLVQKTEAIGFCSSSLAIYRVNRFETQPERKFSSSFFSSVYICKFGKWGNICFYLPYGSEGEEETSLMKEGIKYKELSWAELRRAERGKTREDSILCLGLFWHCGCLLSSESWRHLFCSPSCMPVLWVCWSHRRAEICFTVLHCFSVGSG